MGNDTSTQQGENGRKLKDEREDSPIPVRLRELSTNTFHDTYRLHGRIGTGSHSQVFLAVERSTGVKVAVKAIYTEHLDRRRLDFLRREIAILKEVSSHPFIVRLLEVYDDPEGCYIVQELAHGGSLWSHLHGRASLYTEEEVKPLLWRLLVTVRHLHDRGIVHRDIKPENLLVMTKGEGRSIKLADFGFALRLTPASPSESLATACSSGGESACGTPEYVAPEVLLMQRFDGRADVWSVGVTAFCLLGGSMPFVGLTLDGLFKAILSGSYSFRGREWSSVSEEAKDFVGHMLEVEMMKRWTAEQLLDHPWMRGCEGGNMDSDDDNDRGLRIPRLREVPKIGGARSFKAFVLALIFANALLRDYRRRGVVTETKEVTVNATAIPAP